MVLHRVATYRVVSDFEREAEGWSNHVPGDSAAVHPQFIGFQCLGCGKRHAQLAELIECHEEKRERKVQAA